MVSTSNMRRTAGLVLVVAVVLAGCSGVLDGGSSETTGPSTANETTSGERLAPGLTDAGVVNASALVVAHESVLGNQSFTRTTNATARTANGSVLVDTSSVVRVGPPGEGLDSVVEQRGSATSVATGGVPAHREVWTDGGPVFVNNTYANGTTRYERLPADASGRSGAVSGGVEYALEAYGPANTSVSERRSNGSTRYVVTSDTNGTTTGAESSLRLVVDERGVIHELRTETSPAGNTSSPLVRTAAFSGVGTTEVPERPAWVGTAMNRTAPNGTTTSG